MTNCCAKVLITDYTVDSLPSVARIINHINFSISSIYINIYFIPHLEPTKL